MVPGWNSDQRQMQMLLRALAYVNDFHIVSHKSDNLDSGGSELKQAFDHTNLAGDAVGLIAAKLEVPEEWPPFMSARCVIVWLVLNFG